MAEAIRVKQQTSERDRRKAFEKKLHGRKVFQGKKFRELSQADRVKLLELVAVELGILERDTGEE